MSRDEHAGAAVEPQGRGRALLGAVGLILAFVFVQATCGIAIASAGVDIDLDPLSLETVLALVVVQLVTAAAGVAWMRMGGTGAAATGLRGASGSAVRGWNAILPAGLVIIGPSIALVLADGDPLADPGLDASMAFALVALAAAIGINEELWFRGLVVARLRETGRLVFTVLASALLFGLPHLSGDPAFVLNAIGVTLAVGIPFACVRLRHGSLVPLVVMHVVIDAWAFLQTGSIVATGDPSLREIAIGLIGPALLAAAYLVWFVRWAPAQLERSEPD